jgi:hypothetical protein
MFVWMDKSLAQGWWFKKGLLASHSRAKRVSGKFFVLWAILGLFFAWKCECNFWSTIIRQNQFWSDQDWSGLLFFRGYAYPKTEQRCWTCSRAKPLNMGRLNHSLLRSVEGSTYINGAQTGQSLYQTRPYQAPKGLFLAVYPKVSWQFAMEHCPCIIWLDYLPIYEKTCDFPQPCEIALGYVYVSIASASPGILSSSEFLYHPSAHWYP